ncbi:transcription antitermination factor NusB [Ferrimicrobium sp.]|uniref:transcription antitermination factor NusB n=1 Tax=Ferrimicrobium sp. TaxID=2926050 RepID=UPI00262850C7|nr:transcription antitermination factor NusB [Ferrimicrobium sp.]MCL5973924.1 transcription antitermination factor NusB [Actinomycetota bacterium]
MTQHHSQRDAIEHTRVLREQVVAILYEALLRHISPVDVLGDKARAYPPFVTERIAAIDQQRAALETTISEHLYDWALSRLNPVDRSILMLGVWELQCKPELPTSVVIAEAIRLADLLSTEDSPKFINGVLAAVATQYRPTTPVAPSQT